MPLKVLIPRFLIITVCLSVCVAAAILETNSARADTELYFANLGNGECQTPTATPTPTPFPSGTCPPTRTFSFSNSASISPADRLNSRSETDPGLPVDYPSSINVEGLPGGSLLQVYVSFDLTSDAPDDLDILLVGPEGQRSIVISDSGGFDAVTNRSYTFTEGRSIFPNTTAPPSGTYSPSNDQGLCAIEPNGLDNFPEVDGLVNYPVRFENLRGAAEGVWSLYVVDDETGNLSSLPTGWTLDLTLVTSGLTCNSMTPTPTPTPPTPTPTPYCFAGRLDTTFDGDGIARTAILDTDVARSLVMQPDGKTVVAGHSSAVGSSSDFALARFNADGSLDVTFDGDGRVTTSIGASADEAHSVAMQSDGKIVAGGWSLSENTLYDFALARYNSDGSLDTTFDDDGKVTIPIKGDLDLGYSVAIQTDGKIILAGTTQVAGSNYDFALLRVNTDGSLDTTFDNDGIVTTPIVGGWDEAYSVAIQADGRIVAAGRAYSGSNLTGEPNFDIAVVRYNPDGSLDMSFDGDGKVLTNGTRDHSDSAESVAIQPDGKIVVAGYMWGNNDTDFAIVRYNVNGSLDPTFHGDGRVTTRITGDSDRVHSVAIQRDGKIVAAGASLISRGSVFTLTRYNPNGSLDTTFDEDGLLATPLDNSAARAVSVQRDGMIVAAGDSRNGPNGDDFTIVRYHPASCAQFDYDADRRTDLSVFRPAGGVWYLQRSTEGFVGMQFGFPDDRIIPADFDRDGRTDIAVFRPSDLRWHIANSSDGTYRTEAYGLANDLPAPADYDGDGKADLCVFRPSDGTWYLQRSSNGSYFAFQFGGPNDKPTVGDFDGDGKSDFAVFRTTNGEWYQHYSSDGSIHGEQFGFPTDKLAYADYDGDGKTDLAVFRPSDRIFYIRNSATSTYSAFVFGLEEDIPTPGDYDGDGKADISVFRPSDGNWYRQNSSNGSFNVFQFGLSGDRPTPGAFQ